MEMTSVETGLGTETAWISRHLFFHRELMSVKVTVKSSAETLVTVRVSVSGFDEIGQPFDFSAENLTLNPLETRTVYLEMYIPNWALPGENCQVVATAEILPEGAYCSKNTVAFYLLPTEPIHDVSLVEVVPSETEIYVGREICISVLATNEGNVSESFSVTCKVVLEGMELTVNETAVSNLFPHASMQILFTWTATEIGEYQIVAEIPALKDETDTSDNLAVGSLQVKVKIFGDVNGDGVVNMQDIGQTSLAFGSGLADPRWNSQADLNQDNKINLLDVALVARNFGRSH